MRFFAIFDFAYHATFIQPIKTLVFLLSNTKLTVSFKSEIHVQNSSNISYIYTIEDKTKLSTNKLEVKATLNLQASSQHFPYYPDEAQVGAETLA